MVYPMPLIYVSGDPALTQAQTLAISHNAKGRSEMGELHTHLLREQPAAFSMYQRQCRNQKIKGGTYWMWTEAKPRLLFLVLRDSSVGATRLRYVQSAIINLARDYRLEGIQSLAITPLGQPHEWKEIKLILDTWFRSSKLPVVVYNDYQPGITADETPLFS